MWVQLTIFFHWLKKLLGVKHISGSQIPCLVANSRQNTHARNTLSVLHSFIDEDEDINAFEYVFVDQSPFSKVDDEVSWNLSAPQWLTVQRVEMGGKPTDQCIQFYIDQLHIRSDQGHNDSLSC